MNLSDVLPASSTAIGSASAGWDARLMLDYERRGRRTVLARRQHFGPLRVQRDLYPEGVATCHTIVVHPPGGIAGGDRLALTATLGENSEALLTTPGASKWYRSAGPAASQALQFDVGPGAVLEWLPQETIVYDGAIAGMKTSIRLAGDALYLGWEVLCFGRTASGERFAHGTLALRTEVMRNGRRLWLERGALDGGDALLASPVGLAGHTVCGTLIAAGREVPADVLAACRTVAAGEGAQAGLTRLPGACIARWLGDSSEEARRYFSALWALLRPALAVKPAVRPRIWAT